MNIIDLTFDLVLKVIDLTLTMILKITDLKRDIRYGCWMLCLHRRGCRMFINLKNGRKLGFLIRSRVAIPDC